MLEALVFYSLAAFVLGFGVLVVTARNTVHSVQFLVGNLLCVAILYVALCAEFLAVIQVLVYAGGIVVLYLFVVMLVNLKRTPEVQVDPRRQSRLEQIAGDGVCKHVVDAFEQPVVIQEDEIDADACVPRDFECAVHVREGLGMPQGETGWDPRIKPQGQEGLAVSRLRVFENRFAGHRDSVFQNIPEPREHAGNSPCRIEVLDEPPRTGLNWLVYILPPLAILAGAALLLRAMRSWTRKPSRTEAPQPDESLPKDEYVRRLEEELKNRK